MASNPLFLLILGVALAEGTIFLRRNVQ